MSSFFLTYAGVYPNEQITSLPMRYHVSFDVEGNNRRHTLNTHPQLGMRRRRAVPLQGRPNGARRVRSQEPRELSHRNGDVSLKLLSTEHEETRKLRQLAWPFCPLQRSLDPDVGGLIAKSSTAQYIPHMSWGWVLSCQAIRSTTSLPLDLVFLRLPLPYPYNMAHFHLEIQPQTLNIEKNRRDELRNPLR